MYKRPPTNYTVFVLILSKWHRVQCYYALDLIRCGYVSNMCQHFSSVLLCIELDKMLICLSLMLLCIESNKMLICIEHIMCQHLSAPWKKCVYICRLPHATSYKYSGLVWSIKSVMGRIKCIVTSNKTAQNHILNFAYFTQLSWLILVSTAWWHIAYPVLFDPRIWILAYCFSSNSFTTLLHNCRGHKIVKL